MASPAGREAEQVEGTDLAPGLRLQHPRGPQDQRRRGLECPDAQGQAHGEGRSIEILCRPLRRDRELSSLGGHVRDVRERGADILQGVRSLGGRGAVRRP